MNEEQCVMPQEIWKPVVGFEGLYEVSDRMRVRSLVCRTGTRPSPYVLKPTRQGRLTLTGFDGNKKGVGVHGLHALAFDCRDEMPGETWRAAPGFVGRYEVSDHGRVRSLVTRWGLRPTPYVMRGSAHKAGYCQFSLYDAERKKHDKLAHVLVLTAFVGPCPDGLEGCHEDGDPTNNRLSNLRWDTHASNCVDTVRHGRSLRGERSPHAKLKEHDVLEIRRRLSTGETQKSIAADFGVHQVLISLIHRRKRWAHV